MGLFYLYYKICKYLYKYNFFTIFPQNSTQLLKTLHLIIKLGTD
ncbi:hypothetical protein B4135_0896 [Caldibacillus debilis]|uniref:Uncharacterized protein n=1 Tax=Caldibacillus debilis TaxID=301148 RepID=A0A150M5Y6_9BACI|nr:hypothetical protein B4135_0896 [Caldibacillus debilis]